MLAHDAPPPTAAAAEPRASPWGVLGAQGRVGGSVKCWGGGQDKLGRGKGRVQTSVSKAPPSVQERGTAHTFSVIVTKRWKDKPKPKTVTVRGDKEAGGEQLRWFPEHGMPPGRAAGLSSCRSPPCGSQPG